MHQPATFGSCLSPATPGRPQAVAHLAETTRTPSTPATSGRGGANLATPKVKRRSRARSRKTTASNGTWNTGKWGVDEDAALREGVRVVGARQWKRISVEFLHNKRSDVQCLHRWQKVLRPGLVKGAWEKEEDETIVRCIKNGITKWSEIAAHIPGRLGKQCRERWFNHLDPSIKKGGWTTEEDAILEQAQAVLGNRWCKIAEMLPGRTENAVKNRWHSAKRRQAHAERMAHAAAARKKGQPLPPPPKLTLPATRRKSKSHTPTPAAAIEAARRCGLRLAPTGAATSNKVCATTQAAGIVSAFSPRSRRGTTSGGRRNSAPRRRRGTARRAVASASASASASAPNGRGKSWSAVSPTRPAPAARTFIFPSDVPPALGGAEVVSPFTHVDAGGAAPTSEPPSFGLMQLITAIDTTDAAEVGATMAEQDSVVLTLSSLEDGEASARSSLKPLRIPAHGRQSAQRETSGSHMEEPDAHTPIPGPHSSSDDEFSVVEALQAMHDAPHAVARCTPSPPLKLSLGTPVTDPQHHVSYTLLPPPMPLCTGDPGVSTFIVQVSDADEVRAPPAKRSREASTGVHPSRVKRARLTQ